MHQNRLFLRHRSAPDPTGGAYSAPPDSLVGFKGSYWVSLARLTRLLMGCRLQSTHTVTHPHTSDAMHSRLSTDCHCCRRRSSPPRQKITKEKLHENAYQNVSRYVENAPEGVWRPVSRTRWGSLSVPPKPLAIMRGPTSKGEEREGGNERGVRGEDCLLYTSDAADE